MLPKHFPMFPTVLRTHRRHLHCLGRPQAAAICRRPRWLPRHRHSVAGIAGHVPGWHFQARHPALLPRGVEPLGAQGRVEEPRMVIRLCRPRLCSCDIRHLHAKRLWLLGEFLPGGFSSGGSRILGPEHCVLLGPCDCFPHALIRQERAREEVGSPKGRDEKDRPRLDKGRQRPQPATETLPR